MQDKEIQGNLSMNNFLPYKENEAININRNDRDTNVTDMFLLNRMWHGFIGW